MVVVVVEVVAIVEAVVVVDHNRAGNLGPWVGVGVRAEDTVADMMAESG